MQDHLPLTDLLPLSSSLPTRVTEAAGKYCIQCGNTPTVLAGCCQSCINAAASKACPAPPRPPPTTWPGIATSQQIPNHDMIQAKRQEAIRRARGLYSQPGPSSTQDITQCTTTPTTGIGYPPIPPSPSLSYPSPRSQQSCKKHHHTIFSLNHEIPRS